MLGRHRIFPFCRGQSQTGGRVCIGLQVFIVNLQTLHICPFRSWLTTRNKPLVAYLGAGIKQREATVTIDWLYGFTELSKMNKLHGVAKPVRAAAQHFGFDHWEVIACTGS